MTSIEVSLYLACFHVPICLFWMSSLSDELSVFTEKLISGGGTCTILLTKLICCFTGSESH
jgi:hypothetical protein